ncbi:1,6-anhydro-N-acetylmuramyl-L-alanine amidase AmpD [Burkholderia sp. WAC0059]|uniref:1,6-anhydro-N-acetylmuramyl-L-alanine amidase AmpD n=1 Tax=Burkholderia sp. WAC0059 TaxID=2066022 RepID=UPI000C7F6608|nr:1,6-anhydro-N-acetylmuramyl-L-alanine amidase AmpD [Burkholderia sp. WAC0059]PLZ01625.1 1,6-anhydro-N-acetylmuramyl-L-alanine amidase AmpD [Burkholderia sp. WAC0059]
MTGAPVVPIAVDASGWTDAARRLASPNFEARPAGVEPTLIVVHNISLPPDAFGGSAIADLFLNRLDCDAHPYYDAHLRGVRVSAHFLIGRDGALVQFVSCNARAWHAGVSNFFGRERCNDFSIGIELEGSDTRAFEAAQYVTLAALVQALVARYPIDALAGHSDIAPGRKTDPGPHFDWARLERDTGLASTCFPYLHGRGPRPAAP